MKFLVTLFFILIFGIANGQQRKAKLIFSKNNGFTSKIEKIISENDHCPEGVWYVETDRRNNFFILSKSNIPLLLKMSESKRKKLCAIALKKKLLFVLMENNIINSMFNQSNFFIILEKYNGVQSALGMDYSYWIIMKKGQSCKVVDKNIFSCD